jgi:hypothetical protein
VEESRRAAGQRCGDAASPAAAAYTRITESVTAPADTGWRGDGTQVQVAHFGRPCY